MKSIKLRIKSMESTKQITRAMQMVAASKLRRAQERIEGSRPYFEILSCTIADILSSSGGVSSPYIEAREVKRSCYVVIAGDRGLAGGYNSNILKMVYAQMKESESACAVPIGKKAVEFFENRGVSLLTRAYAEAEDISVGDCFSLARELSLGFLEGEYDDIYIAWTNFTSLLSQSPASMRLLPLRAEVHSVSDGLRPEIVYEPSAEEVFEAIVPEYLGGIIYGALCESVASEQAARRNAMDAATKNAEEMIDKLSLSYNRARQGAITQEITEIVGGASG
ncbi:MAG: ATP synthase F1 subunit gamma [Oscillospiraceae bacterium]|nr:ATP synthase F1 subunit gamma [Oscillospiraceae bacterium]